MNIMIDNIERINIRLIFQNKKYIIHGCYTSISKIRKLEKEGYLSTSIYVFIFYNFTNTYLIAVFGSPNLFFLHSVWPWNSPIKPLLCGVIANSEKPLLSAA